MNHGIATSVSSRRFPGKESGAVLPLVALSLLVLFMFAALTVDLGAAWAKRRTAQASADTAVLAAAVEFQTPGSGVQDAVDQALDFANRNLNLTLTTAQWEACTDAESLELTVADLAITDPTLTPLTDCISFAAGGDEVRVKLPNVAVPTTFARVAGFNSIDVTAAGNASIRIPSAAQAPPFVVLSGTAVGDQVCLRTSSAGADMPGQWVGNDDGPDPSDPYDGDPNDPTQPLASEPGFRFDPCDENPLSSSQFFGTLNPYYYEEASPVAPDIACTQPGVGSIDVGIADGIDHNLSTFEPNYTVGDPERIDGFGCPGNPPTLWPNTMATQAGFSAQKLKCGLIGGGGGCTATGPTVDGTSYEARLRRGDTTGSVSFAGQMVTNKPLWHYLLDAGPSDCQDTYEAYNDPVVGADWDYWDIKEEMIVCLQDWKPAHGQIFDDDIVEQGRFAWIPILAESTISTPLVHFDEFVPAWINGLYQAGISVGSPDPMCWSQAESAPGLSGWYRHEAGLPFDCGRSNQNVDRVSAIVFDCGMLSADLCDPDQFPPSPGGSPIFLILLTK